MIDFSGISLPWILRQGWHRTGTFAPLDRPVHFDAITRTQFEEQGHQPDDWTCGTWLEGEEDHAVARCRSWQDQDRCSMPSAQTGPTSTGGDVIMHLLHCPIPIGGDDRMPSLSGSTRPTHRSWGTKHQFGDISWHMHSIFRRSGLHTCTKYYRVI